MAERRAVGKPADAQRLQKEGRNNGLPDNLFTDPFRYKENAIDGDPSLHRDARTGNGNPRLRLDRKDFAVHHLIPMEMVRKYLDLFKADSRAGWHPDEAANLLAMPKGAEQQTRMGQAMGQQRPIHNSGHREWNEEVERRLEALVELLKGDGIKPLYENTNGQEIRRALEKLQQDLRHELLDPGRPPRLTQRMTETEIV